MSSGDGPIVKLVDAVLITSIKKQARYISWIPGRLWFYRRGHWYLEMQSPVEIHTPLMRRLSIMLGHLAPGRVGESVFGGIPFAFGEPLQRHAFAMLVERTLHDRRVFHRAFLERISDDELAARRPCEPHLPANPPTPGFSMISDPYRGQAEGTLFTDARIEEPAPGEPDLGE